MSRMEKGRSARSGAGMRASCALRWDGETWAMGLKSICKVVHFGTKS